MMSIHEECGVFGIFSDKPVNAAKIACQGLYALQHRGQESCGIVVCKDRIFTSHKDTGLVKEVFTPSVLSYFPEALWQLHIPVTVQPDLQAETIASLWK